MIKELAVVYGLIITVQLNLHEIRRDNCYPRNGQSGKKVQLISQLLLVSNIKQDTSVIQTLGIKWIVFYK